MGIDFDNHRASGTDRLAGIEVCLSSDAGNHGKVALPDIHPDHIGLLFGGQICDFKLKTHQQEELLLWFVIPEFCRPDACAMLNERNMLVVAYSPPPRAHPA